MKSLNAFKTIKLNNTGEAWSHKIKLMSIQQKQIIIKKRTAHMCRLQSQMYVGYVYPLVYVEKVNNSLLKLTAIWPTTTTAKRWTKHKSV